MLNLHGLSQLNTCKKDTKERLLQSSILKEFIRGKNAILLGDFNLNPETKSMKMLEEEGLTNLITKYQIVNTRSELYKKAERFADYILLSAGIKESSFAVLPNQVSDHLPLYLEY